MFCSEKDRDAARDATRDAARDATKTKTIRGLYALLDTSFVEPALMATVAEKVMAGGCRLLQLRAKDVPARTLLKTARELREITRKKGATFILNNRVDLALLAGADGVHLGQLDLPVKEARELLGEDSIIGLSTHNPEEVLKAEELAARGYVDYISFGPVFATKTKEDAEPVVGVDGLREARALTRLPITAIGGITEEDLPSIMEAGADAVAMVSEILLSEEIAEKVAGIVKSVVKSVRG